MKIPQPRNQPGSQQQADQQRRQTRIGRAERDVLKNVEHPQRRPVAIQRIEKFVKKVVEHQYYGSMLENAARRVLRACSSFTPRDPLIRTTSPFFNVRARRSPACTASRTNFKRERSTPDMIAPSRISVACP